MNAFCACPFRSLPVHHRRATVGVGISIVPVTRTSVTTPYAKAPRSSKNKRPRTSRNSPNTSTPSSSSSSSPPISPTSSSSTTASGFSSTKKTNRAEQNEQQKSEQEDNDLFDDDEQNNIYKLSREKKRAAAKLEKKSASGGRKKSNNSDSSSDIVDTEQERARELSKVDKNGISMEHRLREEILHPLRKPKQTLFATLAFSATLGFFFACGRLVAEKDDIIRVSTNVAIDIAAITLFGYLTWREFDFGRRSLNSIAGIPQPRDLPIIRLDIPSPSSASASSESVSSASSSTSSSNFFSKLFKRRNGSDGDQAQATDRLNVLLRESNTVVIVAGRGTDVVRYVDRCAKEASYGPDNIKYNPSHPALVVLVTDANSANTSTRLALDAASAVAATSPNEKADWIAWLADAIPPRRNVALFRISKDDGNAITASGSIVTVNDPDAVPLPADARRVEFIEV